MKRKGKRRVSGIGGLNIEKTAMDTVGISAGALIPEILISKAIPNVSPKMTGIGQIVAGAALRAFMPNELAQAAGAGVIAGGAIRLGQALMPTMFPVAAAPVNGIGEADFREAALTLDTDFDTIDGLDQESSTPEAGNGPIRS